MPTFTEIDAEIRATGLVPRGGFHPSADDAVPSPGEGRVAGAMVLVGNAGPSMWEAFAASAEHADGEPHALDRWSARVVGGLAARLGASAVFPFGGPPWHPFLRWAQRAEPVYPSPIGPLVHPDYGLAHAYRGALVFAEAIDVPARAQRPRPCDACPGQPCRTACPVGAFTEEGYDVARCVAHVDAPAGAECAGGGCLARRACPVGREFLYAPAQAAFHMRDFVRANRAPRRG